MIVIPIGLGPSLPDLCGDFAISMVENSNNLGGGDTQHITFSEDSPAQVFEVPVCDQIVSGDVHAIHLDSHTHCPTSRSSAL